MKNTKENPKTDLTTQSEVTIDCDNLLPIQKINQYDLSELNEDEKTLRSTLLDDLEKAQLSTAISIYYYIRVGITLIRIKKLKENEKKSYIKIIESIGFKERTAFRYISLAKDKRFAAMTEDNFKSLQHLTQAKMIMMTTYDNDKFNEAINNKDFIFQKEKKEKKEMKIEKPSEYSISDEIYKELMQYDMNYVIQKYDLLYKKYIELQAQGDVK